MLYLGIFDIVRACRRNDNLCELSLKDFSQPAKNKVVSDFKGSDQIQCHESIHKGKKIYQFSEVKKIEI